MLPSVARRLAREGLAAGGGGPTARALARPDADRSSNVLGMVVLATFFVSMSSSTLGVALPVIVRHFHAGALPGALIALTPSAVSTSLLLALGRLGDIAGRNRSYLLGLLAFSAASLLLGSAPDAGALIALQVCQAIGISAVWANSAAIIIETQPEIRLNQAFGLYIAAISVGELIGPTVGGVIAQTAGWRWIFWLNVPIGTACVLWGRHVLRTAGGKPSPAGESGRRRLPVRRRQGVDAVGGSLLVIGLLGFVVSLSLAQSYGVTSDPVLAGTVAAVAVLVAFVLVESRAADPLLDLSLLRARAMRWALVSGFLNAMAQWGPVLLMVLFFQAVQGRSPLVAGLRVTPLPICSGITALLAGWLGRRVPVRTLAVAGSVIAVSGLVLLALTIKGGYLEMVPAFVLVGTGSGVFAPAIANILLRSAPPDSAGAVNGARLTLQNLGWVIAAAMVLTVVTGPLAVGIRHEFFAGTVSRVSPAAVASLHGSYRIALLVLAALGAAGTVAAGLSRRSV
jgi:MFS family permease